MNKRPSLLHSLTRLTIGGVLIVMDELANRLPEWDAESEAEAEEPVASPGGKPGEVSGSPLQDGLVGFTFEVQEMIQANFNRLNRMTRWAANRSDKIISPFTRSWVGRRIARRIDALAERGQREVDRWIDIGRYESAQSKAALQTAVKQGLETTVSELSVNPEIQQLIQSQSASLAGEVVDEIRERSISADNYFEAFARDLLKRPFRKALPEPPREVKEQAKPFRRYQGRTIRK